MKLLILKRDKIGDMLLTTPVLHHLRRAMPDAEIHLLANDYNAWVVEGNRDVDRLWVYPRTRYGRRVRVSAVLKQIAQTLRLRRERFDAVIAAGGEESPRAIKRAARLGGRRTIAYLNDSRLREYLTDPLPEPKQGHEIERMLDLFVPLGFRRPEMVAYPCYAPPDQWRAQAAGWLQARGLSERSYVVLGLGARRARKQPSTEQILRWSAEIKNRFGLDTVFMWTPGKGTDQLYPGDDAIAEPVLASRAAHLHPCREPLLPAIGLIWLARTSIFPDSGLMHFAAASPGGVVGLFATGSHSPDQWGPRGTRARFLEAPESVSHLPDAAVYAQLDELLG